MILELAMKTVNGVLVPLISSLCMNEKTKEIKNKLKERARVSEADKTVHVHGKHRRIRRTDMLLND